MRSTAPLSGAGAAYLVAALDSGASAAETSRVRLRLAEIALLHREDAEAAREVMGRHV